MRQIVLDTETTGLETKNGHRIIEIGCVEMINRRLTGNNYHQYIQPEREIDAEAMNVHGITHEFLEDKPVFAEIADDFYNFIKGAELIIHNAPFDVGFIDYELGMLQNKYQKSSEICTITDTLVMARKMFPGQKNNLDALCRRYSIDNTKRVLHGALLDSEILADVYLAMTGGQISLSLGSNKDDSSAEVTNNREENIKITTPSQKLMVISASNSELEKHNCKLDTIDKKSGGACLWRQNDNVAD
ncbi:MAG: DNA polymerase III subunit epsilon [Gammaproteobacteria bacterium]|nr:MAG: DNA polymerase III subunit epsilon [Gammaproteobacteria bacterium]